MKIEWQAAIQKENCLTKLQSEQTKNAFLNNFVEFLLIFNEKEALTMWPLWHLALWILRSWLILLGEKPLWFTVMSNT